MFYQPWIENTGQFTPDLNWASQDVHLKRHALQKYQRPGLPFDSTPGIHTLLGPRRIGKSTQFKLWIQALLSSKTIEGKDIIYLDAERFEKWDQLYHAIAPFRGRFLFIDEVTAPQDWERALKVFADEGSIENLCIWVTSSNAFALKHSGERLPGRRGQNLLIRDAELLPLKFKEFHRVFEEEDLQTSFDKFLKWGGYPASVSECLTRSYPSVDWLQELLDVVLGEVSRQHRSPRLTTALSERIWLNLSQKTSYHAISKMVDMGSHPIIRQYIEILEGCYTLLTTERFNSKTKSGVLRKEKKFYFFDPLVMQCLVSYAQHGKIVPEWLDQHLQNPTKKGTLVEAAVATELRKNQYPFFYDEAHGGEIDFILPYQKELPAIEVKLSMPSLSEVKPLTAYPKGEVWVYRWQIPHQKEIQLGSIRVCSLIERLMEL